MPEKTLKYIVVLGSMMSGLGKGIVTSSVGRILQSKGYAVSPIKFDGYLNVDCGTMNPLRHGEVFVLDDGTECDMDFGTYERFLNTSLRGSNSITGGKLFRKVIEKERAGGYLGRDVQIVPHLTDEIKNWIRNVGAESKCDFVLVEVGGHADNTLVKISLTGPGGGYYTLTNGLSTGASLGWIILNGTGPKSVLAIQTSGGTIPGTFLQNLVIENVRQLRGSVDCLGCRDGGRIDLRADANGTPQFMEVNPLAGLRPGHSDLPILCGLAGMSYQELIAGIMHSALKRLC